MMHPVLAFLIGIAVVGTPSVCECPPDLPWYCFCDDGAVVCFYSDPPKQGVNTQVSIQMDSTPITTISPTPTIGSAKTLPSFEAIFALAGLVAVAYLMGRKGA